MSLDESVSRLIADIYSSVHDASAWDRVMGNVVARTGSRYALVSAISVKSGKYLKKQWHGPDDGRFLDALQDYDDHNYRHDPTLQYGMRHPAAGGVTVRHAFSVAGLDLENSDFAKWMRGELGAGMGLVRYTLPDDGMMLGFSIHPGADRHGHDDHELALIGLVFEHVRNALHMIARPIDLTGDDACLLVDKRGLIRSMSSAAEALLQSNDGLAVRNNRLIAASRKDNAMLETLLRAALRSAQPAVPVTTVNIARPSGRRPWLVKLSTIPVPIHPFEAFCPALAIMIIDADAAPTAGQCALWARTFGLTASEVKLAETLMAGLSLRQAADALGITYSTARVHLRNLFEKAQVQSQSQLARLLTRIG